VRFFFLQKFMASAGGFRRYILNMADLGICSADAAEPDPVKTVYELV